MSLIHKEIRWLHKLRNNCVTKAVSGPQGSEEQYGFVSAVIDAGDPVGRWRMDWHMRAQVRRQCIHIQCATRDMLSLLEQAEIIAAVCEVAIHRDTINLFVDNRCAMQIHAGNA